MPGERDWEMEMLVESGELRSQGKFHGTQGEIVAMGDAKRCYRHDCTRPVAATLGSETLCLEHFCSQCYQLLEKIDQRTSGAKLTAFTPEQIFLADDCARKAIDVCLSANSLNNLERARLLDILLWCGEISSAGPSDVVGAKPRRERARYEKPQLRRVAGNSQFPS
jgi:hypothetical protein